MRKRKVSGDESEDGSEMDVDGEEKREVNESDVDDEESDDHDDSTSEEDSPPTFSAPVENPFLDSFYDLSSEDSRQRSKAAQVMLQHCLLSSGANAKDAAYAFRRLLNGVCSGRAAARQGNASALASFLKLAFHLEKMEEIRGEQSGGEMEDSSLLAYVRGRLLAATDPNQTTGKKKGSEERDYQFGRLFGILAIIRSNVLVSHPSDDSGTADNIEVASALVSDLVELFWTKRWMREPAAHGITSLLKIFFDNEKGDDESKTLRRLIEDIVIPKVLLVSSSGEMQDNNFNSLVSTYCAEQLGIALYIQSQKESRKLKFSFPLNRPIVSSESIPLIVPALRETSVVVQPRMHFVWDALWCYLSEPFSSESKKKSASRRQLRKVCPGKGDSTAEVLDLIMQEVVSRSLLCISTGQGTLTGKATHERRALALCIVKLLAGVAFSSSLTGPTQLVVGADLLESCVLTPSIVRSLFIDVLCAGNEKKKTTHILRPLALDSLRAIVETTADWTQESNGETRMAVTKSFLNSEIRFDARTRTSTIMDLLGLTQPVKGENMNEAFTLWNNYIDYLQSSLLSLCEGASEEDSSAKATGYVELLYIGAKLALRLQTDDETKGVLLKSYKETLAMKVLRLFLTSAFFHCENVKSQTPSSSKKKKKKRETNEMLEVALKLKKTCKADEGIPVAVRAVVSARFFSLLAEFCGYATHAGSEDSETKIEKDSLVLAILDGMCDDWKSLEETGAKRFVSSEDNDEESVNPEAFVAALKDMVNKAKEELTDDPSNELNESKKRCCTGFAVLGFSLYLHRLSCGANNMEDEDPDADDENDEEEICSALESLKDIAEDFFGYNADEANPLLGLAELCSNILSSPLGSGNMGRAAAPKLIREAIKFAWLGGLRQSAVLSSEKESFLDKEVIHILLDAIGASSADHSEEDGSDGKSSEDDESDEESEDEGDDDVFLKAAKMEEDPEDMHVAEDENNDSDKDSEVELDPTKLQSMLENDDFDDDDDILEHHEGADAALAKLIRLRQDARKAGQRAREKIEVSHQLRCTFLLELLFSRSDGWSRLFRSEVVLDMLLPMIRHRKSIEHSLSKSMESSSTTGNGEKQALMDRLTSLLQQKLGKMRLANLPLAAPVSIDFAADLVSQIIAESKRADSQEQISCCNSSVVLLLRSVSSDADSASIRSIFENAVLEWSTKRTTKLKASTFEDLIAHAPNWSHVLLALPLSKATRDARSPYLKTEAIRMITQLLSVKPNVGENLIGKTALETLKASQNHLLSSIILSLQDEEMRKAKRARTVLRALEKLLLSLSHPVQDDIYVNLGKAKELLENLGESESQGIQTACTKLIGEIDIKVTLLKASNPAPKTTEEDTAIWAAPSKSKKKKKKKKKR